MQQVQQVQQVVTLQKNFFRQFWLKIVDIRKIILDILHQFYYNTNMAYGLLIKDAGGKVLMDTTSTTLFNGGFQQATVANNSYVDITVENGVTSNSLKSGVGVSNVGGVKTAIQTSTTVRVTNNSGATRTILGSVWNRGDNP